MNAPHPLTAVALYSVTRDGPVRAAVFRWSVEAGVSLQVIDDRWHHLAHAVYESGAPRSNGDPIPRALGQAFMRGLIEYTRATYLYYLDESHTESGAHG